MAGAIKPLLVCMMPLGYALGYLRGPRLRAGVHGAIKIDRRAYARRRSAPAVSNPATGIIDMRIIGGEYRSRRISPARRTYASHAGRHEGVVFNILQGRVAERLCWIVAGSGALGLRP